MRNAVIALGLLTLTGCAPMSFPGVDKAKLQADYDRCYSENVDFVLIPDFGTTAHFFRKACMNKLGWLQPDGIDSRWFWVGRPTPTPTP